MASCRDIRRCTRAMAAKAASLAASAASAHGGVAEPCGSALCTPLYTPLNTPLSTPLHIPLCPWSGTAQAISTRVPSNGLARRNSRGWRKFEALN